MALALVLWGAAALAQSLNIKVGARDAEVIGPAACPSREFLVTWDSTSLGITQACQPLALWVTPSASCGTAADTAAGDLSLDPPVPQAEWPTPAGTSTRKFSLGQIPSSADGGTCGLSGAEKKFLVCGYSKYLGVSGFDCNASPAEARDSTPPSVTLDAKPPDAPVLQGVAPLDKGLRVTFTVTADAVIGGVEYRALGAADFTTGAQGAVTSTQENRVDLSGLVNGTTYEVRVWAQDQVENRSSVSALGTGTPVPTFGFWDNYQTAGGAEAGGCSHAGTTAAPLALALLALGSLAWRRRSGRTGQGDA